MKKIIKSCVAMLLAFCMVFGMMPAVQVSAESGKSLDTDGDGIVNYVSFGDSVTNGYGLEDYRYEDGTNVYGLFRAPKASYPALIRDELAKEYNVNLTQMAISGFRMNELAWMLCDDYNKDSYHYYWFDDWNQSAVNGLSRKEPAFREKLASEYGVTGYVDTATADSIVMAEYRKAVKDADLITIDLGTNNFGTFVTRLVMAIINQEDPMPYETNLADYMDANTAASLEAMLAQMVGSMVGENTAAAELAMTLARCLMYGYLGYTENYDKAIEAIYELNPDVNVVVVDCYSMITGVNLSGDKLDVGIPLSDLYNMFVDMANFYSRELSPYAHKVTHATLDTVPELFIDYYKDYPDAAYPDNQYLHPTAERLMNEFLMEAMGMDADDPDDRSTFKANVLDNITALDGYVNNLQETVESNVIATIDSEINTLVGEAESKIDTTIMAIDLIYTAVAGAAEARAQLPTAQEGVAKAKAAVSAAAQGVAEAKAAVNSAKDGVEAASAAVDTAIDGVASAQSLVDMIVELVVGNSMFSTSSAMKSLVIGVIKSNLEDMDLSAYGYSNADIDPLAEEIYAVACKYKDTSDKTAANKDAVIEVIRFNLNYKMGYSEADAIATANQAWELNAIVSAQGKPAAIQAAIETQVTSEQMEALGVATTAAAAEKIYFLGTSEESVAVKAVIETQMTEAKLAELGLSGKTAAEAASIVYDLGTKDTKSAVILAMSLQVDQATAELAYAMVEAYDAEIAAGKNEAVAADSAAKVAIAASLTDAQMAALAGFGITDRNTAAALILTIADTYNSKATDKEGIVAALVTIAALAHIEGIDEATASTGYDLYAGVCKPALEAGKSVEEAKAATVVTAMAAELGDPDLAAAVYAIYKNTATADQKQLAYITLMVSVAGIPYETAVAIYTCYATDLNGQFKNENVKTTMIFLMMKGMGMSQATAADSYDNYLMYKNLPGTLSKIAKCDTIYFDALLNGAPDMDKIANGFKNGTLVLDKPADDASEAEWAAYKSDSAMATLYFRFLAQDGVFTHPSEIGQEKLYKAAMKAIEHISQPEEDSVTEVTDDTKLLILGDFVTANPAGYGSTIAGKLGIPVDNVTNLSNPDFRINEVRALLDSEFVKDAYAQAVIPATVPNYAEAVKNNDLIVLNLGSMNMGLIAKQLGTYLTTGSTYGMSFSALENMQEHNLGKNVDALMQLFTPTQVNAVSALLLTFKTYGYGFTTFADSMAATVSQIKVLNPDAQIVLVGMYDLLGDAFLYEPETGAYLELGHFINHAVDLMNQRMEIYADMNEDVAYIDVTGIDTNVKEKHNLLANGMGGIAEAFANATPTAEGYAEMAQRICCGLGVHTPAKAEDITWEWVENDLIRVDDHFIASAKFHCVDCGEDVQVKATITTTKTDPSCTQDGSITYSASIGSFVCPETKSISVGAIGHDYQVSWKWSSDYSTATAILTCANDNSHVESIPANISVETVEASCNDSGKTVYTATAAFGDNTYTDVQESVVSPLGHSYTTVVTSPTCEEDGYTTYTCSRCGDHYIADEVPALGHDYGENGKCHCGEIDPDAHPACEYRAEEALVSGKTYILNLGGSDVGSYTFQQVSDGWTIQGSDGTYLAIENSTLVSSASAYTWTYSNGMFSGVVTTTSSSGSNNWWSNIFGGWWGSGSNSTTTSTTYYLVASGQTAAISTSSNGANAAFYTIRYDISHDFDSGVVHAPSCDESGYTTFTCNRCGYSYNGSLTAPTGHDYQPVVTAPTCDEDGYTTYTCSKCGDSYTENFVTALGHNYTSTVIAPDCKNEGYTLYTCSVCGDTYKDNFKDSLGHSFVDGICSVCGDAEEPEHPLCEYRVEETLKDGLNSLLSIGGEDLGYFTFTKNGSGWNIMDGNGQYLALSDGELIRSSEPFAWTFSNQMFNATTASSGSSNNNWWGNIFGGWWGSGTSSTTYYLIASNGAPAVSTSNSAATVKLYSERSGDHAFMDPISRNGKHVHICENCGYEYEKDCTDPSCELCHPVIPEDPEIPEAKIQVSVSVTSSSSGSSWFDSLFGRKTYTATISVSAEGTEVSSVAYSTDNGNRWTTGTSFTSSRNITNFKIRVQATNGETYYFTYSNGTVTQN